MDTVLLTTSSRKLDDIVENADASSRTHVAVKFDKYYLAFGSVFADLLPSHNSDGWTSAVISRKLAKLKFWSMIPISKGLSRDFELRRVYLADVHVCEAIANTLNGELDDVSFENSARSHSPHWSPELSNTFILFSETEMKLEKGAEDALRQLYAQTAPVNRSMIGDPVAVICTPFKNLMLFNSYSQGVISNVLGENNCVFLTDVKVSLGCEGSPIFSLQNRLLGMVMHVFTWVRGEWTGFSMAVNLHAAVGSWVQSSYPKLYESIGPESYHVESYNIDSCGVVAVSGPYKWGSGIVFDKCKGIIITCSHVVDFSVRTAVTITFKGKNLSGEVLYATAENIPYDLAVIKVHSTTDLQDVVEFKKPTRQIEKGETVFVIAYPLFSPKKHAIGGPSLTRGYVANIYPANMVLTTCVTNSGASGGALIRSNGELLGVVTNNVIIEKEKLLVPHITVVIPSDVFWSPVERFCRSHRVVDLNNLTSLNRKVLQIWQLNFSGRFLESKL